MNLQQLPPPHPHTKEFPFHRYQPPYLALTLLTPKSTLNVGTDFNFTYSTRTTGFFFSLSKYKIMSIPFPIAHPEDAESDSSGETVVLGDNHRTGIGVDGANCKGKKRPSLQPSRRPWSVCCWPCDHRKEHCDGGGSSHQVEGKGVPPPYPHNDRAGKNPSPCDRGRGRILFCRSWSILVSHLFSLKVPFFPTR